MRVYALDSSAVDTSFKSHRKISKNTFVRSVRLEDISPSCRDSDEDVYRSMANCEIVSATVLLEMEGCIPGYMENIEKFSYLQSKARW